MARLREGWVKIYNVKMLNTELAKGVKDSLSKLKILLG